MLNTFYDKFIFAGGLKYKHNNFYLMNLSFAMVPVELLAGLASRQDKDLDLDVYYSIKDATHKGLMKQFDVDFGLGDRKALQLVQDFFTASGWGLIETLDMDPKQKRAILTVSNSPVAQALHGKAKLPVDHFLRGVFAGLFTDAFKKDMDCVETECSALNTNKCKFVIKEAADFDFKKPEPRRQLRVK